MVLPTRSHAAIGHATVLILKLHVLYQTPPAMTQVPIASVTDLLITAAQVSLPQAVAQLLSLAPRAARHPITLSQLQLAGHITLL